MGLLFDNGKQKMYFLSKLKPFCTKHTSSASFAWISLTNYKTHLVADLKCRVAKSILKNICYEIEAVMKWDKKEVAKGMSFWIMSHFSDIHKYILHFFEIHPLSDGEGGRGS